MKNDMKKDMKRNILIWLAALLLFAAPAAAAMSETGAVTEPATLSGSEAVTEDATAAGPETTMEPATVTGSESVKEDIAAAGSETTTEPASVTELEALTEAATEAATWEPEAKNVLVVSLSEDWQTDEVIYERDSGERIYPASTLKMLTALTVLDLAQPEEKVRIGLEFFLVPDDASRSGLKFPMKLTVRELLEGLLLSSGADAAYALAAYCGEKLETGRKLSPSSKIDCFVDAMNRKAAALGAMQTTAVNADGYDAPGQLTTARDLLFIAEAFLKQPLLREICAMKEAELTGEKGTTIVVRNTNEMLHEESPYYNEDVTGVKTGTTSLAGGCLVSSFAIHGKEYVCVVMNSSDEGRYTDTQKLYELCANRMGNHEVNMGSARQLLSAS